MKKCSWTPIVICFLLFENHASAQWVQINGFSGRSVMSFATKDSNIFAGILNKGVFLSTNYGITWVAVNSGLTTTDVGPLLINGELA